MFCTRCGKDVKEGNSFCEGCGAPVPCSEAVEKATADTVPLAPVPVVDPTAPMSAVTADEGAREAAVSAPQDRASTGSTAFCTGCGAPLKGDTAFCTRCGKPVGGAPAVPARQAVAPAPMAGHPKQARQFRQPEQEKSNKGLIIGLIAAGVVLLAAAGVVLFLLLGPSDVPSEQVAADVPAAADANRDKSSAGEGDAEEPPAPEADDTESSAPESTGAESASKEEAASEPEPAPVEEPAASEYILPDSDTHAYTTSELGALSDWELFVARNEIFARHGRGFLNEDLARYFSEKSWYTQRYSPEEFDAMSSPLSAVEKQNTETILALEQSRGSEYL